MHCSTICLFQLINLFNDYLWNDFYVSAFPSKKKSQHKGLISTNLHCRYFNTEVFYSLSVRANWHSGGERELVLLRLFLLGLLSWSPDNKKGPDRVTCKAAMNLGMVSLTPAHIPCTKIELHGHTPLQGMLGNVV